MGSKRNNATPAAKPLSQATSAKSRDAPILSRLGVYGLHHIEPVILGALISGEPLLLIGPHGTGKSYLLNRLCQALGLVSRHYNASLISFDDLVGYPLPNERRELEYVQTPASIWGAQAVFIDEISRCRPELQNKLFPIIYERRVQGILLESLEYRWAAMNPPASDDSYEVDAGANYLGSEPLDPALADRFALIVPLPEFKDYNEIDQLKVILTADCEIPDNAAAELRRIVASGRSIAKGLREAQGPVLAEYVREVVLQLGQGEVKCSPRRAATLLRNITAVHAARLVTGGSPRLQDSAWLAVRYGLPGAAAGEKLNEMRVLAAHQEAWSHVSLPKGSPLRLVLKELDPVRRLSLASRLDDLSRSDFSVVVADVLAQLRPGARHAVAALLFGCFRISAGQVWRAVGCATRFRRSIAGSQEQA
jgi:MoxR-like ATPase